MIIVDKIPVIIADIIGEIPYKTAGIRTQKINPTVAIIDMILLTPFFLPIKINKSEKIPAKIQS